MLTLFLATCRYAKGIWYPIGGFYKVIEALENIGRNLGVDFRYGVEAKRIVTKGKRTEGVELADGTIIEADVVVSNADLVWTYNNLLPAEPYAQTLACKDQ